MKQDLCFLVSFTPIFQNRFQNNKSYPVIKKRVTLSSILLFLQSKISYVKILDGVAP